MMECPCKGCDRRTATCHAECPDYPAWRAEYDASRAAEIREREKNRNIVPKRARLAWAARLKR